MQTRDESPFREFAILFRQLERYVCSLNRSRWTSPKDLLTTQRNVDEFDLYWLDAWKLYWILKLIVRSLFVLVQHYLSIDKNLIRENYHLIKFLSHIRSHIRKTQLENVPIQTLESTLSNFIGN